MSRYSKEKQDEIIARIRSFLVRKPDLTIREVQDLLAGSHQSMKLDKNYVGKLLNKIRKERTVRLNNYTVNVTLAKFEDEAEDLKARFYAIVTDRGEKQEIMDKDGKPTGTFAWVRKPPSHRDVTNALKEIRQTSIALFDKMFDSGVFERQVGNIRVEDKLSDEEEEKIKNAINFALKPRNVNANVGGHSEEPEVTD